MTVPPELAARAEVILNRFEKKKNGLRFFAVFFPFLLAFVCLLILFSWLMSGTVHNQPERLAYWAMFALLCVHAWFYYPRMKRILGGVDRASYESMRRAVLEGARLNRIEKLATAVFSPLIAVLIAFMLEQFFLLALILPALMIATVEGLRYIHTDLRRPCDGSRFPSSVEKIGTNGISPMPYRRLELALRAFILILLPIALYFLILAIVSLVGAWQSGAFWETVLYLCVAALIAAIAAYAAYSAQTLPGLDPQKLIRQRDREILPLLDAERQWLAEAPDATLNEEASQ